jgi:hypothetical protein
MIDERFAPSAFERLRDNPDELARLQTDLETEVTALVLPAVEAAMADVAALLNALGHRMVAAPPDEEFSGVEYSDGTRDDGNLQLWVDHTPTVTVGYAGIDTPR